MFYELVRVALGNQKCLSKFPTKGEWGQLFDMVEKQCVAGITFFAIEALVNQRQKPSEDVVLEWFSYAEQIKIQNEIVNQRCIDITKLFAEAGFRTCILKGQGNARMYPNPLARVAGDIDIWVIGKTDGRDAPRQEITDFVRQQYPDVFEQYHHIDFPIYKDVPVEVHYTPGRLLSPNKNKRFQKWCREQRNTLMNEQYSDGVVVYPSVEFNTVYQIAHIMVHFFNEGIGLRHFVDYYYVLFALGGKRNVDEDNSMDYNSLFDYLGVLKFARGVMWIEKELLGLNEKYLIVEPSEKVGLLIKKEMEEGGNMGQYDKRYTQIRQKGLLARGMTDVYRLLTMANYFPTQVFWKIVNKIGNQRWKIKGISI